MTATVTFDGAPPPGTINFGVGQPSADLLPVELLQQASAAFFRDAQALELNYGVLEGDPRFLDTLAAFLSRAYGAPADPGGLFVSGGVSQALDLVATVFASPGDTVFVEEPSYFLAFQIFRDHGLNLVGIPVDAEGMRLDALEQALADASPAFVYTIPSYQNPGGHCMSAGRRQALIDLAEAHDFLIVADEVYQLLNYFDAPPAAFGSMQDCGRILSLGSFSKLLAPGMRLGWVQTSPQLRQRLMASGLVNSGGSLNHLASHVARLAIELGLLENHVDALRQALRQRLLGMDAALREHFGGLAEWRRPEGGYFFWLRFDPAIDTAALRDRASELQTGFQAGRLFSPSGGCTNYLRLSFAHYDTGAIESGIARLRAAFD